MKSLGFFRHKHHPLRLLGPGLKKILFLLGVIFLFLLSLTRIEAKGTEDNEVPTQGEQNLSRIRLMAYSAHTAQSIEKMLEEQKKILPAADFEILKMALINLPGPDRLFLEFKKAKIAGSLNFEEYVNNIQYDFSPQYFHPYQFIHYMGQMHHYIQETFPTAVLQLGGDLQRIHQFILSENLLFLESPLDKKRIQDGFYRILQRSDIGTQLETIMVVKKASLPLVKTLSDFLQLAQPKIPNPIDRYQQKIKEFILSTESAHKLSQIGVEIPEIFQASSLHLQDQIDLSIQLKSEKLKQAQNPEDFIKAFHLHLNNPPPNFIEKNNQLIFDYFGAYKSKGGTIGPVLEFLLTPQVYFAQNVHNVHNAHKDSIDPVKLKSILQQSLSMVKHFNEYIELLTLPQNIPQIHPETAAALAPHIQELVRDHTLDMLKKLAPTEKELLAFKKHFPHTTPAITQLLEQKLLAFKNKKIFTQLYARLLQEEEAAPCGSHQAFSQMLSPEVDDLIQTAAPAAILPTVEGDCPICYCPYDGTAMGLQNCSHTQCADCFTRGLKLAIKEQTYPLNCVIKSGDQVCNQRLTENDLKQIPDIKGNELFHWKFSQLRKELLFQYNFSECAGADCKNLHQFRPQDLPFLTCEFCQKINCASCRLNHGPDKSCEQAGIEHQGDAAFKMLIAKGKLAPDDSDPDLGRLRPCYYCGVYTYRVDGCNSINGCKNGCDSWHWNYGDHKLHPLNVQRRMNHEDDSAVIHDYAKEEQQYEPLSKPH